MRSPKMAIRGIAMLDFLNRLFDRSELHKEIEARRRVEEALRQSEERYRELLEKANDIIYTHDLEGNFTSANEAVERILGYRPEEFVLMNMAQVLPAEHLDRARQMVQRKIAQGDRTTYE